MKTKINEMKMKMNELKTKMKMKINELKMKIQSIDWEKTKKDFLKIIMTDYYSESPIPRTINYYLTKARPQ